MRGTSRRRWCCLWAAEDFKGVVDGTGEVVVIWGEITDVLLFHEPLFHIFIGGNRTILDLIFLYLFDFFGNDHVHVQ